MTFTKLPQTHRAHVRVVALIALAANIGSSSSVNAEPVNNNEASASLSIPGDESLSCYRITVPALPDEGEPSADEQQVWCYQTLPDHPGSTFVFNADESEVKPELAAIIDENGQMVHGSLLAGETTVHRLNAKEFNPLPAPLAPPANESKVEMTEEKLRGLRASREATLNFLRTQASSAETFLFGTMATKTTAKANTIPWRGYWWPYSSMRMSTGTNSPLAKYDRFVRARGGDSFAQNWENEYHDYENVKWQGHCNGWASSSILRKEPKKPVKDPKTGITFSVSDLKGLLAEKDNCVKFAFFGERFRSDELSDRKDIYPQEFHQTLTYYIGKLKKPVVMDRLQGVGIENNVISAYTMTTERTSEFVYTTTVVLRFHKYDTSRTNVPGPAPSFTQTYKYALTVDKSGKVVGQTWLTKNPDFLWVPIGEAQCRPTNPYVTAQWINMLVK